MATDNYVQEALSEMNQDAERAYKTAVKSKLAQIIAQQKLIETNQKILAQFKAELKELSFTPVDAAVLE